MDRQMVPGQQSHHGGDDADQVEDGICHLVVKDPVGVGGRVTGDAGGAVSQGHGEIHRHTAQHDHPVDRRLRASNTRSTRTSPECDKSIESMRYMRCDETGYENRTDLYAKHGKVL